MERIVAAGDRSASGIAAAVGRLVSDGDLAAGERLPTVRQLAISLDVSPTTVAAAWRMLIDGGVIETRGRSGTYVRNPGSGGPARFWQLYPDDAPNHLDLSEGVPDPVLLPPLGEALARLGEVEPTTSYLSDPVVPGLADTLRSSWEFAPPALTVLDGALDALDRVVGALCRVGSRVVVENPTFPPLLDLLEVAGARIMGVDVDDQGMVVDGLREAVGLNPVAVFLQPRAQNPTGVSMTADRAERLTAVLRRYDTVVVEDDHSWRIGGDDPVTLGTWLPERTTRIRSFSKSYGPELRLAALGGPGDIVEHVVKRRRLGASWTSRILQQLLVDLLADPSASDIVDRARRAYADRRRRVTEVFDQRGVSYTGTDGLNLWFAVADERAALVDLASRGIGVAPGTPFFVTPSADDHLRVTVAPLGEDAVAVAEMLADSARFQGR
jgi:DNA-binding transcriptional MocR family regulator